MTAAGDSNTSLAAAVSEAVDGDGKKVKDPGTRCRSLAVPAVSAPRGLQECAEVQT
jgi:hypothetical protein